MLCGYCDSDFEPSSHLSKYCSPVCSKRMAKIKRKLREKKRANTLEARICKGCGRKIKFYNMRLYCRKCKAEAAG